MRCAKFATFKGKYTPFFLAPSFFPPKQQPPLGCIVDHGGNGSPWRRTCPSGHVEHPKNTVQDSGVSLLTMGRKFRPTRSFHSFLPSFLFDLRFLSISPHLLSFFLPYLLLSFSDNRSKWRCVFQGSCWREGSVHRHRYPKHTCDLQLSVTTTGVMCTRTQGMKMTLK